jgi:hypothetical protein
MSIAMLMLVSAIVLCCLPACVRQYRSSGRQDEEKPGWLTVPTGSSQEDLIENVEGQWGQGQMYPLRDHLSRRKLKGDAIRAPASGSASYKRRRIISETLARYKRQLALFASVRRPQCEMSPIYEY